MIREKQHDAHVRNRARLAKRIVNRWYDWGVPRHPADFEVVRDLMTRAAFRAIAEHPELMVECRGRYQSAERYGELMAPTKDIGASAVHALMVYAMYAYDALARERGIGGRCAG